jgi:sulfate adenylyltransferase
VRDAPIKQQLLEEAETIPDIILTEVSPRFLFLPLTRHFLTCNLQRQLCDLELIQNGGFSPLEGFMNERDYKNVVSNLRLADGALFPIPITLDISREDIDRLDITPGKRVALRDPRDDAPLAIITVEDIYQPDKVEEAIQVLGADDPAHPSVAYLRNKVKDYYIGGAVQAIQGPTYFDYVALRCTSQLLVISPFFAANILPRHPS